jgi:UDP-N-acetylglucosamine 1-carboxyvinyltransferase
MGSPGWWPVRLCRILQESHREQTLSSPSLVIEGGHPLRGSVRVGGSKNTLLYALPACLLTAEECVLENVPEIEDSRVMAAILGSLGARVEDSGGGVWRVQADAISRFDAPNDLVVNLRGSFLVMGPLLARFGEAACCSPGGDVLGTRPLDVHLEGFSALGARVSRLGEQHTARLPEGRKRLRGSRVFLDYPSVTGTVNLLFAAVLAEGETTLINTAAEPEIVDIIAMLNAMGARISGAGASTIKVEGVPELHGVRHRIPPDRIETGIFAIAGAISRGDIRVEGAPPDELDALLTKLRESGVGIETNEGSIRVIGEGREFKNVQAQALPYPGLATDHQPYLAAFLTQAQGVSVMYERVYDNRLLYVGELRKLGADVIAAGQTAIIVGPTRLYGTLVKALDVRAGGALVLAALAAQGRTEISDTYHLDRAHEDLAGKLRSLGATVVRQGD